MIALPHADGLSTAEVLDILQRPASSIDMLTRIANGVKNNFYCDVDNSFNKERQHRGHNKQRI